MNLLHPMTSGDRRVTVKLVKKPIAGASGLIPAPLVGDMSDLPDLETKVEASPIQQPAIGAATDELIASLAADAAKHPKNAPPGFRGYSPRSDWSGTRN